MSTSLGTGCGRAEGSQKKCQPVSMVTLIISKFSLVGVGSRRVKFGTLDRCRPDERSEPRSPRLSRIELPCVLWLISTVKHPGGDGCCGGGGCCCCGGGCC